MGTRVDVLLPERAAGLLAVGVETLFVEWETTLTRFSSHSELSRLNAAGGRAVAVSRLLFDVVEAALEGAKESGGIFDPTLLRELVALGYDRTFDEVRAADPAARPWTPPRRSRVAGWADVRLDRARRTISVPRELGLDLGGIAKGMAVDTALRTLAAAGCAIAAIDAGGDLAVLGAPAETGWPVRVELPDGWRTISVPGGALATSGTSRRRWRIGEAEVHHLIDPRSRAPVITDLWSVTVAAETCREAEIAATTAFVLGPGHGAQWLAARELDGLFVFADGRQVETGPWAAEGSA